MRSPAPVGPEATFEATAERDDSWAGRIFRVRGGRHKRAPRGLVAGAAAVAVVALLPLGFVVDQAVSVGLGQAERLLIRPLVGTLLVNTVLLTVTATAAATVLGIGVAWLVERTDLPGRRLWAVLAALPITVPAFVTSYSWVSLTPAVQGFWGAALIVTLAYYPLIYLPVAAVLRGMDPALEESARTLGLGPWRTFLRVTLPQAKLAVLGGALLVAVHLLAEYGAFAMLRFQTFTTAIYDEYRLSFDGPAASMLATVLVALCLALLLFELRLRGRARYARVGAGAARQAERLRLGRMTPIALVGFGALIGVALGLPLVTLGYWLVRGASTSFPLGSLAGTAGTALELGLGAAALTTALALPVSILVVRYPGRLATTLERSTYFAYALPGIVIALALIIISVNVMQPLYQTTMLLLVAYALLFLPLALVAVRAALAQAAPALEENARALGAPPWRVLVRVTLPLIAPGLGAAAALVFLSTITELTATLLLAPIGTQTLATRFWSDASSFAYGAAAPYAALMVALSAPPTYILTRKLGAFEARSSK
ncbi:MAG TPA: iron ABC transporter permease [Solirubrobacteraceae bacterium]|jgi:iron(III) transport system permease protein